MTFLDFEISQLCAQIILLNKISATGKVTNGEFDAINRTLISYTKGYRKLKDENKCILCT